MDTFLLGGGLKLNRTRPMRASLTFPTFGLASRAAGFRKFNHFWQARPSCFTVASGFC